MHADCEVEAEKNVPEELDEKEAEDEDVAVRRVVLGIVDIFQQKFQNDALIGREDKEEHVKGQGRSFFCIYYTSVLPDQGTGARLIG